MAAYLDRDQLDKAVAKAALLPRLHALIVAHEGKTVAERVFLGPGLDHPINIRSASKPILAALVGIAIDAGMIESVEEPILPLLKKRVPQDLDPRTGAITIHHLLSMRAGLQRTSGRHNSAVWLHSPDWVGFVLSQPFIQEPGGSMVYSTGNSHLLSAILTDVSGTSTWELARLWLGEPLGITIPQWTRDPQGIYLGGNDMLLSPRDLLHFGEMYCNGGYDIVPRDWISTSWIPHATDSRGLGLGRGYGYGWFLTEAHGLPMYYAAGLGGHLLCVIPDLSLTIVVTADDPANRGVLDGQALKVHELLESWFMPATMPVRQYA